MKGFSSDQRNYTSGSSHLEAAIANAVRAVEHLRTLNFTAADQAGAVATLKTIEAFGTRVDELQTSVAASLIDAGVHAVDAHGPAAFLRHHTRATRAESTARIRCSKAARDLPKVSVAWREGRISTSVMRRIAQAHANVRVREQLIASETTVLEHAERSSYHDFDRILSDWTRLVDEDGTHDRNERNHNNRDASLLPDFDHSWTLAGGFGSLQGAELNDIFKSYIDAEFRIDWDQAVAEHGEAANALHRARTDKQRRADALHRIFLAANVNASGEPKVVTNLVIDQVTFARWVRKLAGEPAASDDPWRSDYRCHTLDGVAVEPGEAVTAALLGEIRRTVIDAKSVVIDRGRKSRLFTGSARLAAQLGNTHCVWPGCEVPTTACQIDHISPWADGGCTCPENSCPMCGRHN